ncbi:MAG: DUF3604 domain-containing protein [Alphaproteobacteria bacterium]|nr:DUF3604 domain-containing protein [Alphaproteobacteria bacterium]
MPVARAISIRTRVCVSVSALAIGLGAAGALAADGVLTPEKAGPYSPAARQAFPTKVLWGDTHLHSNLSVDANGMGNRALTPEDAYRFAKGEAVTGHNRTPARLRRPLDFLVVADHDVNLGVMPAIAANDPLIMKTEVGKAWAKLMAERPMPTGDILNAPTAEPRAEAARSTASSGPNPGYFWGAWGEAYVDDVEFRQSVWNQVCDNAERHNDPGNFTAFIGYEYTPPTGHARSPNFHRIVIFEDGKDKACDVLPFSYQDSADVEDLWAYLEDYEEKVGGRVLAIPHNGNLSSGMMFRPETFGGEPIGVDYAKTRARWEPLYEMTQIKGDAEAHPILSPTDEFADYETWHVAGFFGKKPENFAEQKQYEYARPALKVGLDQQAKLGVNPFKFGMIGATDAHTSFASVEEDNFWGKTSLNEPSPYRLATAWHFTSSGYAAVWAEENTREAIFAAMKRKETYATTGPRMTVRFFGGWNYAEEDAFAADLAEAGYSKGVPMGGDLTKAPRGKAPSFLVRAVKDPEGANLDRVQIVKGWRAANGELMERVYDVAVSDGRTIPADGGKVEPVGSTVDVENATYTNTIGDPELAVVWTDPDFDPKELAFYYVRVIEIPKPRWTAYDRKIYHVKEIPEGIPMVTQDRAYTSPIWYTPS